MPDLPDIAAVDAASRQLGLAMDASELHGALCGWLAGGGATDGTWLARALYTQLPRYAVPLFLRLGGRAFWSRTHGRPPYPAIGYARSRIPQVRR